MKKRLKRSITFVIEIFLLLLATGCGTHDKENESLVSKYDAVYSNLVDVESQIVLKDALKNAGVSQASIDILNHSITKYIDAVGSILPVQKEFAVFTENSAAVYNVDKLERLWKKNYKDFSGRKNCRITAYEAMGSLIDFDISSKVIEPLYLVEISDTTAFYSNEDIDRFSVLFNGIESNENSNSNLQAEQIKGYWTQAGVNFPESSKISLISIWFNAPDPYSGNDQYILHCGHAAVLIHLENDEVLLLEKLDYNFPYQLIRFPSEQKALQYIVEFNCGEINDEEIVPVVFVNNQHLRIENDIFVY